MTSAYVSCLCFAVLLGQSLTQNPNDGPPPPRRPAPIDPRPFPPAPAPLTTTPRPEPSPLAFIGSQYMTPGEDYELKIYIISRLSSNVNVRIEVKEFGYKDGSRYEENADSRSFTIPAGTANVQRVILRPRQTPELPSTYNLRLSCDVVYCSGNSITLNVNRNSLTDGETFVQLDKPKYKANDEVKFRAIVVNSDLKPANGLYNVIIKDARDNTVRQWANQTLDKGVFGSSMQLSEDPVLGIWRVIIRSNRPGSSEVVKTFQVEEYVLPKYELTFDGPPYHVIGDRVYRGKIKAKYTHGGGVAGTAVITVSYSNYRCGTQQSDARLVLPVEPSTRCGNSKKITQKLGNGEMDLELSNSELMAILPAAIVGSVINEDDLQYKDFQLKIDYTEDFTNINSTMTKMFDVRKTGIVVKFAPFSPNNYKVGMPFKGFAMVEKHLGLPLTNSDLIDSSGRKRQLSISYLTCRKDCTEYGPEETCHENAARLFDIDQSGLVAFELPSINKEFDFVKVKLSFTDKSGNEIKGETQITPFCQGTTETLRLTVNIPSDGIKEWTNLRFNMETTVPVDKVYYEVVADNKIVSSGETSFPSATRNGNFDLWMAADLYNKMAPRAKVMAWALSSSGSFLADTVMISLDKKLSNQVSIKFNTKESSPGNAITFSVQASPDSHVGILGVDKSVQLLGTGNDITIEDVKQRIDNDGGNYPYPPYPMPRFAPVDLIYCPGCGYRQLSGSNIPELLSSTGLFLSSTANQCNLRAKECPYYYFRYPMMMPGAPNNGIPGIPGQPGPQGPQGPQGIPGAPPPPQPAPFPTMPREDSDVNEINPLVPITTVRTLFPETWLWMDEEIGSNGQKTFTATLPDTVTTWVASAWAINAQEGLGVANPAAVKSVKPFFVTLSLPYNIVRGEEFLLKGSVFNYLPNEQQVTVTLARSADYTSLNNGVESTQDVQRIVKVPAGQSKGVSFWIIVKKLGQIDIRVNAQSSQAADALVRKLLVKPEGTAESVVQSRYIALSPSNSFYTTTFNINYPNNVVDGSQRVTLSVSGSVMGPVTENVGKFSKLPYGCGEQNMINFVPNILVMKYLTAAGIQNEELTDKALGFIVKGYQREMNYLRDDGSFSAFGNRDKYGSTWLTSYVVKSFAEASQFIGDVIDKDSVSKSVNYLLTQVTPTGEVSEDLKSGNRFLKGGSGSGTAMTAYVMLTLSTLKNEMPISSIQDRVDRAISLATNFLQQEFTKLSDPYTIAIVSYALTMNRQDSRVNALGRLDQVSTNENGEKHWGDVEATSYAMLAKLTANPTNAESVLPSLRWLVKQFGKNAGFSSTQDTVVGLAALSRFATLTPSASLTDLNIRAVADNGNQHLFDRITRYNTDVYQSYRFSSAPRQVTVTASSSGSAIIQLEADYNILQPDSTNDLNIIVDTKVDVIGKVFLKTCVRWNKVDESGMAIVEVSPLSGYEIITDKLLQEYKNEGLQRIEVKGNKLITYWDEITRADKCFNITQFKVSEVGNIQPAEINAFSYYAVTSKARKVMYQPFSQQNVDPCSLCKECCDRGTNANTNNNNNNNNQFSMGNLALGKPTRQSNTYRGDGISSGAENAVDGCATTVYPRGCCTHTGIMWGGASWWSVDLGRNHYIQNVTYYRRSDCCEFRNRDLIVALTNTTTPQENMPIDLRVMEVCGESLGIAPVKNEVTCNKYGRFVYIYHKDPRIMLSLCEVEVYGRT